MEYFLSHIFPRVRRINDDQKPYGPTGLGIEIHDNNEVTCYWGTQYKQQHLTVEKFKNVLQV